MPDYDTIVIGSGAGGLTAGIALAREGQRVLICEQHEVAGGWMHSFTLEGYRFNTGVHYIGELGPGGMLRGIYEGLGVSRDLEFMELNPDGYDHILVGDNRFDIPKGQRAYVRRVKAAFPSEASGIDQLFATTSDIFWSLKQILDERWLRLGARPLALPWFARSGGDLIDHHVKDPALRAFLKGQAGAHGMAPNRVSSAIQAAIMHHYMEGAYHPLGGGMAIARANAREFKRAGGELRLQAPVERILLERRRAVGIQLAGGERVTAGNVVGNADPHTTFNRLIGRERLSRRLRRKLDQISYSTSCLSLYLALDGDPESMGWDSGNYYIHANADLDGIFERAMTDRVVTEPPELVFATVTSLKDPSKRRLGQHQIELFAFAPYSPFARWEDQHTGSRDPEYQRLKRTISRRMIEFVEKRFPGLRERIVFQELGTPLTNQHYVRAHQGNMYGIDKGVWQAGPLGFRSRTEFENLYLCGASTMAHGVAYATKSGLAAASKILDCHPGDLLRSGGPPLRVYQCEDPATWPARYRTQRRSRRQLLSASG